MVVRKPRGPKTPAAKAAKPALVGEGDNTASREEVTETPSLMYPREIIDGLLGAQRNPTPSPDRATFKALVDAVFFASLHTEEGEPVRLSVVWMVGGATALAEVVDSVPPGGPEDDFELSWDVMPFESPRAFEPHGLRKLAKGLKYGRQVIVVGGRSPALRIDGVAALRPRTDGGHEPLRVHAIGPGQLVFEASWGETFAIDRGTFKLRGDGVMQTEAVRAALARISNYGGGSGRADPFIPTVPRVLQRMRRTRSGGILAVLPRAPGPDELKGDFYPFKKSGIVTERVLSNNDANSRWLGVALNELEANVQADAEREHSLTGEALVQTLDLIAQLSAIDGALLVGPQLAVYGAGYIISPLAEAKLPVVAKKDANDVGRPAPRLGARHDAACRFAQQHPDGLAFVVSEDGPVKCAIHAGDHIDLYDIWLPQFDVW